MKQKSTWFFLHYIRLAAKLQLLKTSPICIGITGSAGKTSTQHAVVAALQPECRLHFTYNANSETGLPLSILGIKPRNFSLLDWLRIAFETIWRLLTNWKQYDVLVAEMGIDSPFPPKNMEYLLSIVRPQISILLNAAPMHSEPFDILVTEKDPAKRRAEIISRIAKEKGRIVTDIPADATAIVNSDQKELRELLPLIQATCITFGEQSDAQIQIGSSSPSLSGTTFVFTIKAKSYTLDIKNYALAHHYSYSFAAALATAVQLRIPLQKAIENIETRFTLEPGRSSLIEGKNGVTILDSSYNSSTKPTIEMLEMLPKIGAARCTALLGDIREIGSMTQLEHEAVAKAAAKYCDAVFLVGPQMKKYAVPILKQHKITHKWFSSALKAAEYLETYLKPGDLLLVKSSQNTLLLEIAVEMLMQHPEKAEKLLCRRGSFWDKKRSLYLHH